MQPSPYSLLNSAKKNLEKNEDRSFKYACLDLRECIETITYEKIALRHKMIPESYFRQWQPIELFKVLELLHPESLEEFSLFIGKEEVPGVAVLPKFHVGTHKTFSIKWLKDYYHKLGNYIHASRKRKTESQEEKKAQFLQEKVANEKAREHVQVIVKKLEEIMESGFDAAIGEPVVLACPVCKTDIRVEKNVIDKLATYINCPRLACSVELNIEMNEQGYVLKPALDPISCDCKKEFVPPARLLCLGSLFECPHCKDKYRVTRIEYGKLTVQKNV